MSDPTRRFQIPPWTIIIILFLTLAAVLGAAFTGAWRNPWHLFMAIVNSSLAVGLYFRWQPALWASGILFAVAAGGHSARIIVMLGTMFGHSVGSDRVDLLLGMRVLGLAVAIGGWFLHQTDITFRWFRFRTIRPIRNWFWAVSGLAFIVIAVLLYSVLPKPESIFDLAVVPELKGQTSAESGLRNHN